MRLAQIILPSALTGGSVLPSTHLELQDDTSVSSAASR